MKHPIKIVYQDGVLVFACTSALGIDWFIEKCKTELPSLNDNEIIALYNGKRQIIDEDFVTCNTIEVWDI
jgi:hypothetical protein